MPEYPPSFAFSVTALISIWALLFLLILFLLSRSNKRRDFELNRNAANPLINPKKHSTWEDEAIFNPAAILDDEGMVHLLYRAVGSNGLSQIGHAKSADGNFFDDHSPYPVHQPERGSGLPADDEMTGPKEYNPNYYTSGGGWGGCEDPRAVVIDDRVYMNYVAFEGWHSVRIALTSILLEDLKKSRWNWKKSVLISPPGEAHKNWVLFPEKVNGKYAILHSLSPEVLIEYVENLEVFNGKKFIRSKAPSGGRVEHWDNRVRGAGAPPIKTEDGWLLLYHAMDNSDPNKYKLGAMLLSLDDPTKITHRSPAAILSPEMPYENDGKPGVIYASGAIVKDGNLYVYYGGGDKCICNAHTPMRELLDWLKKYGKLETA